MSLFPVHSEFQLSILLTSYENVQEQERAFMFHLVCKLDATCFINTVIKMFCETLNRISLQNFQNIIYIIWAYIPQVKW